MTAESVAPVIVLWTTPRSRSTAFERMMIERGDHTVIDEPFSARYYFSRERRSSRLPLTEPDAGFDAVCSRVLAAARERPVFVKDMAYHVSGVAPERFVPLFVHSFLVREPRAAIASMARRWPDLTEEEAGYQRLGEVYDAVRALGGADPPVIDADDLTRDPRAVVAAWCAAVGIAFLPGALTWAPGMQPQWVRWRDWYEGVARSTGFGVTTAASEVAVASGLEGIAQRALSVYERLAAARIG
jgi:hypothetical protein